MGERKNGHARTIPAGKTQVNFNIPNATLEKVKKLAFWEKASQSDIYNISVVKYLELYEKTHGKIKQIPAGKGLDSI